MNFLLWRLEVVPASSGVPVPASTIWGRIISSPDPSALVITYRKGRIGFCRFIPTVVPAAEEKETVDPDQPGLGPEGQVKKVAGFILEADGYLVTGEEGGRIRFSGRVELDHAGHWQRMSIRFGYFRQWWEIVADGQRRELVLREDRDGRTWQVQLTFDQLRKPQFLVRGLGPLFFPSLASVLEGIGAELDRIEQSSMELGVRLRAYEEWIRFGKLRTRGFRLEADLFEGRKVTVWINRVGELIKVDLPDQISLMNEAFFELSRLSDD